MLGYVEMREALLWAQTTSAAKVEFEFWETENPKLRRRTEPVFTQKQDGFTAKCVADELEPGRAYTYLLKINGKPVPRPYPTQFHTQTLWQWRSDPPTFTLATGSCAYINEPDYDRPGKPYGGDYQIFTHIAEQKPDVMLWLGDNVYYREPDWFSRAGMFHRYTHDRATPELQALLASTTQLAIWDDHDFGPNDSDGTWSRKQDAADVFQKFWGNPPDSYRDGLPGESGACTSFYQYADVDFFLLDDRWFRSPDDCKTCPRQCLGQAQIDWLIGSLASSQAPFKLVAIGNQFVTTSQNYETFNHFYQAERDTILARIEREGIKGVIFLTGDRHFTELSGYQNRAGHWVYDLTTSPLTSSPATGLPDRETNEFRIAGTAYDKRNFALLRFSGKRKERILEISVHGSDGQEIWKKTLKTSEL